ncbi:MAG: hypothetical protein K5837_00255 [Candidatus Saccharibacteria bacterium]|nr:hypothetical protein [Candidatus Saccharibacteria bacterium]
MGKQNVAKKSTAKVEWTEEAKKNAYELMMALDRIDIEQAKMTPEEKERNKWAAWDGDKMLFKY